MTARARLKSFTRGHAKACRCDFCAILRALPDRALVLGITRKTTAGHEKGCPCVLCETERLMEGEHEIWEVTR
jgi:hypothetical protein